MMRTLTFTLALMLLLVPVHAEEQEVARTLDDFHLAASQADAKRYFGYFAPEGVFLGTDGGERWTVEDVCSCGSMVRRSG